MNSDATIHHFVLFDENHSVLYRAEILSPDYNHIGNTLSQRLWHFITKTITKCYENGYYSVTN